MDRTENSLIHVAQRVFDTPVAIAESGYEILVRAISTRLGVDPTLLKINPSDLSADQISEISRVVNGDYKSKFKGSGLHAGPNSDDDGEYSKKPYQVTDDGVAVISVCGTLVKKSSWMQSMSGMTSYQSIGQQVQECMADNNIRAVMFNCNSPGGETHGLFDLCDLIYGLRGSKPIYAVANDAALSAAYAIASCADRIFVTRTGAVGSIGVFAGHIDQSGADKQAGLKFTYIHAGKKKVDGNPHEPLSSTAKADAQAEVDREYQMFVDLVARNRSADADDIISTQAGVLFAESSIPLLADAVGTFEDCYLSLLDKSGIVTLDSRDRVPADQVLLSRGKAVKRMTTKVTEVTQIGGIGLDLLQSRINALLPGDISSLHAELSSLKAQGDPMASDALLNLLAKKSEPDDDPDDMPDDKPEKKGKKAGSSEASATSGASGASTASAAADDMKECSTCDGTGKDSDGETCETCHGSGEVPKESGAKKSKKGKKAGSADDSEGEGADDGKKAVTFKALRTSISAALSAKKSEPDDEDEDPDEDEDEDEPAPSKKKGLAATSTASTTMSQTDQVIQLCALAGVPDSKAMSWARKGLSVHQVRNKIMDMRSAADRDPEQQIASTFEGSGAISALDGIANSANSLLKTQGKNLIQAEFAGRFKGVHPAVAKGMLNAEAYNRILTANPGAYTQYDDEKPTEAAFRNKASMRQYVTALSARLAQISGSGSEMILARNSVSAPA